MNSSNNSGSPLDEIKRITKAATQGSTPNVSSAPMPEAPEKTIVSPSPAYKKPTGAASNAPSASDKAKLASAISNMGEKDLSKTQRFSPKESEMTRAMKVKLARESAARAKAAQAPANAQTVQAPPAPHNVPKSTGTMPEPTRFEPKNKKKDESPKSKFSDKFEDTIGKGILSNSVKTVIYIVSVLIISGFVSLFAILIGNDCFAFIKSDVSATIDMPKDADLDYIADQLYEKGIIKYPSIFKFYINLRGKGATEYKYEDIEVNATLSYDELISKFTPKNIRKEITITIPEGYSTQEIIDLFIENGIGTQKGFEDAMNYEYDFWFIEELNNIDTSQRLYKLDGYLFPDTYNFYTDASEEDVLFKLLSNFDKKFENYKEAAKGMGKSADDIVIMASLIQKEAKNVNDYGKVAGVFYNRLNDTANVSGTNGKLESDATVHYVMPKEEVSLELTDAQIEEYSNSPYNTYRHAGLPIGPICSPSLNAINWALNPETKVTYSSDNDPAGVRVYSYSEGIDTFKPYFFVARPNGSNYYAGDYEWHLKNVDVSKNEFAAAAASE